MKVGINIIGFGAYIPIYRIKKEEYVKVWGSFQAGITEKAVLGHDEDTITMAVEAGANALKNSGVSRSEITSVIVASVSPPYTMRSMAAEVSMALGLPQDVALLDIKDSEKAGTTALITAIDMTMNRNGHGLVIASDAPRARPSDESEHGLGAGAAALVIGKKTGIARIEGHATVMLPFIADRFQKTGETQVESLSIPGYHQHSYQNSVTGAINALFKELQLESSDFNRAIIQARKKKETRAFKKLIELEKIDDEILDVIGDVASTSTLLALVHVLENAAKPQDRILCVSYGAGAGSDALSIQITKKQENRGEVPSLEDYLNRKTYISYEKYLKLKEFIELG
ncbi:MAG: hydroxymethylglutaryl-CoA synthase [Candidatus Helarchaeota archaeon]